MIGKMKAPSERDKVSMREEIEREMALTRLEDPSVVVDEVVGRSSKTPPSSLTIGSVIFDKVFQRRCEKGSIWPSL